jgi:hypothetical protein
VNDFEDEPDTQLRANTSLAGEAPQPQLLNDEFVRSAPDLRQDRSRAKLLEEDIARPAERPPLLQSAMKGGRRRFLADAKERTKMIATDTLREQGKQREPKSKELKQARKLMFNEVQGGKDALKRAAIPRERRQFNRVGFAPNTSVMGFDLIDAPQEIAEQQESDRNLWKELRGNALGSGRLFESREPVKTEAEQQNVARKADFQSEERSQRALSANTLKVANELKGLYAKSPQEAASNAYVADRNRENLFKHSVGAIKEDAKSIESQLRKPRLNLETRADLMQRAQLIGSSDTNNADATEHAHAQGQTRAYFRGGAERADVVRYANNRGSGISRFFSGLGNFFSKVLPGSQRLFGAGRDNRFEAAPGQREARALLGQERDAFRRDARSGKLGLMRKLFGRTAGSGRSRLPMGPRADQRAPTRDEYADEQRALAAESAAVQPSLLEAPAHHDDDQLLEISSVDGLMGRDDE